VTRATFRLNYPQIEEETFKSKTAMLELGINPRF
jgi:hypothetical protein